MKRFAQLALLVLAARCLGETPYFITRDVDTAMIHLASLAKADFNGDGITDLAGASWMNPGNPESRGVFCQLAADSLCHSWIALPVDTGYRPMGVDAADVDGDGAPDILACSWASNDLFWWGNQGAATGWTKHLIEPAFTNAHEVHAADLDGDGDLDIIAASAGLNQIAAWYSDGSTVPAWTKQVVDPSFGGARSVQEGDLDLDGDLDLVGAALTGNEVSWWRNDGGWPIQWTKFVIDTAFPWAHQVRLHDIDMDGRVDILGSAYGSSSVHPGEIAWWRNTAGDSISWFKHTVQGDYLGAMNAAAADLDLDGDCDIIGTNQPQNELCWWVSDGQYPDGWTKRTLAYQGPWPVMACDLDGDGDTDIVSGGFYRMSWLENFSHLDISCSPDTQTVCLGGSAEYRVKVLRQYGETLSVWLSSEVVPSPSSGQITVAFGHNPLSPSDSCGMQVFASADVSPGDYTLRLLMAAGMDTIEKHLGLEVLGAGQAACVGGNSSMVSLCRSIWASVDSLTSLPSVIGSNYQALVVEQGAETGDTLKLRNFIEGGGTVLATRQTPYDLCNSTSLSPISGWIGATGYGTYTGTGIAIVATYENPFGSGLFIGDTLGTAQNGFGRLSTLTASGVRVARLGSNNAILASVYCAAGAGHSLYYTGGAGIGPESDSLLVSYLRNPVLGVGGETAANTGHCPARTVLELSPNPAHRKVNIRYGIDLPGKVRIQVFNILGQLVRLWDLEDRQAGWQTMSWAGTDDRGRALPGGVYLARLETAGGTAVRKFLMVR